MSRYGFSAIAIALGIWTVVAYVPAAAQTRGVISEVAQLSWNSRFPDYDGAMESITTEKWHYIHGGKFHDELFACCSDRLEQPNLANTAMGRGVVWKLQHEMAAAVGH